MYDQEFKTANIALFACQVIFLILAGFILDFCGLSRDLYCLLPGIFRRWFRRCWLTRTNCRSKLRSQGIYNGNTKKFKVMRILVRKSKPFRPKRSEYIWREGNSYKNISFNTSSLDINNIYDWQWWQRNRKLLEAQINVCKGMCEIITILVSAWPQWVFVSNKIQPLACDVSDWRFLWT